MRVFKTRSFARFAKSEAITDDQLSAAIAGAEKGLIDADLGGGLIKLRVARAGQGKRGGWRTLIAYRADERAIFLFGFAKSDRDNINPRQTADLKAAAHDLLALDDAVIEDRVATQTLQEVAYVEEN